MSQTFVLHKDSSRASVRDRLVRFLDMLPDDRAWLVEIKRHARRRSDQQNRYLWGVVYPAFLRVLPGWDAGDVHEYLLGEHFGWERLEGMGRTRLKPIKRSSKLTKAEFAEYTEFCQRKGAEHGVYVPDPDPFYEQEAA